MQDKLKDFVSTYKPPKRDKPFFGYFKVSEKGIHGTGNYYRNKLKRNKKEGESVPLITKRYNRYYDFTILFKTKRKFKK